MVAYVWTEYVFELRSKQPKAKKVQQTLNSLLEPEGTRVRLHNDATRQNKITPIIINALQTHASRRSLAVQSACEDFL